MLINESVVENKEAYQLGYLFIGSLGMIEEDETVCGTTAVCDVHIGGSAVVSGYMYNSSTV